MSKEETVVHISADMKNHSREKESRLKGKEREGKGKEAVTMQQLLRLRLGMGNYRPNSRMGGRDQKREREGGAVVKRIFYREKSVLTYSFTDQTVSTVEEAEE